MKNVLATADSNLISVGAYVQAAIINLALLRDGPATAETLSEIEDAIAELAPRHDGHHLGASAAITEAIAHIAKHDQARAIRAAETAIEVSVPNTPFEAALVQSWGELMQSHSEEGRIGIFNQATQTFSATTKPALKTEAAAKVAALSVEAIKPQDADLQGIKRVLDLVTSFARSHNNAPLLGLASSHMQQVNNRILFSGPGYAQR